MRHLIASLCVASATVACAATPAPTIPPGHGSVQAEESAAREHDRAAGVLERQAESKAESPIRCGSVGAEGEARSVCWSPIPPGESAYARMQAADQREAAAEHRLTSQALRSAELLACAGIGEADLADSPFAHVEDIVDVQLVQIVRPDRTRETRGARVRFHELDGLSADWLQHLVDCHIARDDAMGHDVPEMSYCPLVPRGARATVTTVPHGFVVDIQSDDPRGGAEIGRRALALVMR